MATAHLAALLQVPEGFEPAGCPAFVLLAQVGATKHLCEESLLDASSTVLVQRWGRGPGSQGTGACARLRPEAQRVTSLDYLNCERVTQLFLQSFEFQQNIFSAMLTAFPPTYCKCGFVP